MTATKWTTKYRCDFKSCVAKISVDEDVEIAAYGWLEIRPPLQDLYGNVMIWHLCPTHAEAPFSSVYLQTETDLTAT